MSLIRTLEPRVRLEREQMREAMEQFRRQQFYSQNSVVRYVSVAAYARLKELQKDSTRSHAAKYRIYKQLLVEVKANIDRENQRLAHLIEEKHARVESAEQAAPVL